MLYLMYNSNIIRIISRTIVWIILIVIINNHQCDGRIIKGVQTDPPPQPKYGFTTEPRLVDPRVRESISQWKPTDGNYVWELSGLDEGDIMRYNQNEAVRNGLVKENARWTNSTVPFYIDENDFTDDQVKVILSAIDEYHKKTCVRFRPHQKSDSNYIVVRGNSTGCWSSVGMQNKGQVVHLQKDGCVRHGIVVHEFLHALGFYHQQSATERDEYVKINYVNIVPGREHNFNKYNTTVITNYNITYDYTSVMHYSEKAFSKNGKNTIESLVIMLCNWS